MTEDSSPQSQLVSQFGTLLVSPLKENQNLGRANELRLQGRSNSLSELGTCFQAGYFPAIPVYL
jgi:hypothetical protein